MPQKASHQRKMKTVEKALDILIAMIHSSEKLRVKDISELCDINKSTVYKILNVMCDYGFVEKMPDNSHYGLGPILLDSQYAIATNMELQNVAHSYMEHLAERCGETVNLMVLIGMSGVYADIIEHPNSSRKAGNVIGMEDHMHASAVGKAILAYMPEEDARTVLEKRGMKRICNNTIVDVDEMMRELALTRERGFAIDDEESHQGSRCVAAPIFNPSKEIIAAVSISGFASDVPLNKLFEYSTLAMETATQITDALREQYNKRMQSKYLK